MMTQATHRRPTTPGTRSGTRILPALGLAAALVLGPSAGPAAAGNLSLGLQGGIYRPETVSASGQGTLSDTGGFVSPILDLSEGNLGVTIKYLYSSYQLDDPLQGLQRRVTLNSEDLQVRFPVDLIDLTSDAERHDADLAVKYRVVPIDDTPLSLTFFTGIRYELQTLDGKIRFERNVDLPPEFEDRFARTGNFDVEDTFSVFAIPLGLTLSYSFPDVGLSPYAAFTIFPIARVDFAVRVNDAAAPADGSSTSDQADQGDPDETGFGGYAVEFGVAYSLYNALEVPMSLTASYRYQRIEPGDFEETVQQGLFGVYYHFVDVL